MTLQTLQPHIDTSLASKTAESVLSRVFLELKSLATQTEYSVDWIQKSLSFLRFSKDLEIGFNHSRATLLAVFKQAWDELPLDFRKQHGYQFINFAKLWTDGKGKSTIDGYVLTAKIWILEEYEPGKQIEIKERAPDGKPILEHGKQVTKFVDFCPYSVELSKLGILNPRAQKDDMTEKLWEMLVDPFFTCDDIRVEHHEDKEDGNGHQYTLKFGLSGPALLVYQNGNSAVVANELNWEEYETDPLVKEAIDMFLKIVGAEMDEDKIFKMVRETYR